MLEKNWANFLLQTIFVTDQHHFDNPVYAYQNISKSQPNLMEGGLTPRLNGGFKFSNYQAWDKKAEFTFDDDGNNLIKSPNPSHISIY